MLQWVMKMSKKNQKAENNCSKNQKANNKMNKNNKANNKMNKSNEAVNESSIGFDDDESDSFRLI